VPDWVPVPREVILFTGACEIAGGLGLVTRPFRWWAAVMLALYAACVFPANVKHAFENVQLPQLPSSWWYHGPRLALQPVIIWWALYMWRGCQLAVWPQPRALDRRGRRLHQVGAYRRVTIRHHAVAPTRPGKAGAYGVCMVGACPSERSRWS
jgi:uncharacterized membrane protein